MFVIKKYFIKLIKLKKICAPTIHILRTFFYNKKQKTGVKTHIFPVSLT